MTDGHSPKASGTVDLHIGRRVRLRRLQLSMTQEKLGAALGLTFQQVQKYEKGTNRISVSRLQDIAMALAAPTSWFYEGVPGDGRAVDLENPDSFLGDPQSLELVRAFQGLTNPKVKQHILDLVKTLSAGPQNPLSA